MIMKKKIIILLVKNLLVHTLIGQTLIEQIENAYNTLDTVSYIENVIFSYKENLIKRMNGDTILSYREDLLKKKVWEEIHATHTRAIASAYINVNDSMQRANVIDNALRALSEITKDRYYSMFVSAIKNNPVHYVLNLMFEKHDQHYCFQPDTNKMLFNLISFDKLFKPQFYVYVVCGKFVENHEFFPTFSKQAGKNVPKIYRKILRKNPQYLLNCDELEGGNTIWYVLNNEIYVYRIIQMKEYKLDDYVKKFM